MNFDEAKQTINQMIDDNYKDFIKALVSVEKGLMIANRWMLYTRTSWQAIMEVYFMRILIIRLKI